ncbi:bifunctional 3-phenylpropionate/cinnamic acid dioxygenase ferredoxin subunit [Demetria terragena]|uniref:bifunctional 3-phenylpropionate/cinnamic acid dioxygenase ferredoxin subunit n=1 Tax=Demetria terragena TaxID=63959 RepID=UPI0003693EF7|nr:bifunctional 3-phenylpropionate/cinnamic acid dioxygenase ferredoxin subunit [Demetria terragena]
MTVTSQSVSAAVAVANLDDLPVGESMTVDLPGQPRIAIFNTADGVYAIDDTCTHQDASLADGWVEDCAVECPLHEACFDLRTGVPNGPPAKTPVRTHDAQVVDGHIFLTPSA